MERLRLTLSANEYDRTRFLVDGAVKAEGIDLTVVSLPSEERHRRFARDLEFDVCELQMGVFLGWMSRGAPFSAIPVFPHRKFCHGNVLIHAASGIQKPADLAGKTVGMRAHFNPVSLWMRGILQGRVRRAGALAQDPHQSAGAGSGLEAARVDGNRAPPQGKKNRRHVAARRDRRLHAAGNHAEAQRHIPGAHRLWPNFREVEKAYYLRTKIFPIRHVVVVKNAILERHPWVAHSLVDAFSRAKEIGIRHASDTRRSFLAWYGAELEEERELFGEDAWAYTIKDNRLVLETMARYAEMAGITERRLEINEMFAESAFAGESF